MTPIRTSSGPIQRTLHAYRVKSEQAVELPSPQLDRVELAPRRSQQTSSVPTPVWPKPQIIFYGDTPTAAAAGSPGLLSRAFPHLQYTVPMGAPAKVALDTGVSIGSVAMRRLQQWAENG